MRPVLARHCRNRHIVAFSSLEVMLTILPLMPMLRIMLCWAKRYTWRRGYLGRTTRRASSAHVVSYLAAHVTLKCRCRLDFRHGIFHGRHSDMVRLVNLPRRFYRQMARQMFHFTIRVMAVDIGQKLYFTMPPRKPLRSSILFTHHAAAISDVGPRP